MFGFIKKIFIRLLSSIVNTSNPTKCGLLSNQKCKIQPTLTNLQPNECTQRLRYYPFAVNFLIVNRCVNGCDLSNKVCVPNKAEDLNLNISNMII